MPETTDVSMQTQTLTSGITVSDGAKAIEFYKNAFGAEEVMRMAGPGGKGIMHAELKIGNTLFYLSDEMPGMGGKSPSSLGGFTTGFYLSVPDADAAYRRAVEAGAQEEMAPEDMFWGDRMGSVIDPFGHHWAVASHKEDVSEEEMHRRAQEFFSQMGEGECQAGQAI